MGHVINPVSQRIGYTSFWSSNWAVSSTTSNNNYSYLSSENILLERYLKNLFLFATRKLFGRGLILIDFKIVRFYQQITIILQSRLKQLSGLFRSFEVLFWNILDLSILSKKKKKVVKSLSNLQKNNKFIFEGKIGQKKQEKVVDVKNYTPPLRYKINPKFIRRTGKLTRYNSRITEPDFWAYPWSSLILNLYLKQRIINYNNSHSKIKFLGAEYKFITQNLIKYLLVSRWLSTLKTLLFSSLQNFYSTTPRLDFVLSLVSNTALTASFVAKYLATRLLQKFPLRRLLTLLVRQLRLAYDCALIHGFKIACNGRFERRGRATHTWKMVGKLPASNVNIKVDYAIMLPVLTNSICAIKVWLTKKNCVDKLFIL